jgi:hypothetical protein
VSHRFRWVHCQIESLRICCRLPQLQKALRNLPRTLDQTYERIVSRIPDEYRDDVLRVLQWLCFSFQPLTVFEISDALSINFNSGELPFFDSRGRLIEPAKDLLRICSTLVNVTEYREKSADLPKLRLAHFSVKEYLVSTRSEKYALNEIQAHDTLGESCLAYLLHFEGRPPIDYESVSDYSLARYAARYWTHHVGRLQQTKSSVGSVDALLQKFTESKTAMLSSVRLYEEAADQCSETAQHNGTRGSVVYRSNQGGTLYRWYHCTTGTDNGTGTEQGRIEYEAGCAS